MREFVKQLQEALPTPLGDWVSAIAERNPAEWKSMLAKDLSAAGIHDLARMINAQAQIVVGRAYAARNSVRQAQDIGRVVQRAIISAAGSAGVELNNWEILKPLNGTPTRHTRTANTTLTATKKQSHVA